VITRY